MIKHRTCGSRTDAACAAQEETHAELFFKVPDLLAERGLRDMYRCGGARKTASLNNFHEIAQLAVLHRIIWLHRLRAE